jgi:hypothetical protein
MTIFAHTRVALGLLVLVSMAALAGCQPGVPDTVKIGVAQPLTGPLKELGQDMVDGTRMAIDDINKEGLKIDGKLVKLEMVTADDKADAEAGKAAAKTLVDAGVVAVIGHLNSGVSIAAAPIYAEKMIPQLAISTNPKYTKLDLPTTLRLVANDDLQSKAMGSIANSLPGEHLCGRRRRHALRQGPGGHGRRPAQGQDDRDPHLAGRQDDRLQGPGAAAGREEGRRVRHHAGRLPGRRWPTRWWPPA